MAQSLKATMFIFLVSCQCEELIIMNIILLVRILGNTPLRYFVIIHTITQYFLLTHMYVHSHVDMHSSMCYAHAVQ